MDTINNFIKLLSNDIPFAVSRFNDGEMMSIEHPDSEVVISYGHQKSCKELSEKLKWAIQYVQPNYWVGIPCKTHFPVHHKLAKELVKTDLITSAVIWHNENYKKFIDNVIPILLNKNITFK